MAFRFKAVPGASGMQLGRPRYNGPPISQDQLTSITNALQGGWPTAPGPNWWLTQAGTPSPQTQTQPSGRAPMGTPYAGFGGRGGAAPPSMPVAGVGAGNAPPSPMGGNYTFNPTTGNWERTDVNGVTYIYNWITGLDMPAPTA